MLQMIFIFTCLLRSYFSLPYHIFLQVLNIPTKIDKGFVEILTPMEIINKVDKGPLAELEIRPSSTLF